MCLERILRQELQAAWEGVKAPAAEKIVGDTLQDFDECENAFRDTGWEEISYDSAMRTRACLSFFTKPALVYFLPGFMLASIHENSHFRDSWDVTEYTLDAIESAVKFSRGSAARLTGRQQIAIKHYLEILLELAMTDEAQADVQRCASLLAGMFGSG